MSDTIKVVCEGCGAAFERNSENRPGACIQEIRPDKCDFNVIYLPETVWEDSSGNPITDEA